MLIKPHFYFCLRYRNPLFPVAAGANYKQIWYLTFSHCSGDPMSDINFTGSKSRCWQGHTSSAVSRRDSVPWLPVLGSLLTFLDLWPCHSHLWLHGHSLFLSCVLCPSVCLSYGQLWWNVGLNQVILECLLISISLTWSPMQEGTI